MIILIFRCVFLFVRQIFNKLIELIIVVKYLRQWQFPRNNPHIPVNIAAAVAVEMNTTE